MKRVLFLILLALTFVSAQAQVRVTKKVSVRASYMMPLPKVTIDKKTKLKTIDWESTENNSWHENIGILNDVPVIVNADSIYPSVKNLKDEDYIPMSWLLENGSDHTVLHCYLLMKADVVRNLWLGNEESVILDKQKGIIYQAQATVPTQCYNKVFGVKGKEGTVLDLQILFPRLPEDATDLAIYGVPAWGMRGWDVKAEITTDERDYDFMPQFHMPYMVKDSVNYDKNNSGTWAVYRNAHLIKPVEENTMALWRTPEATYLAIATEQNWFREYHGRGGNTLLLDERGHQYKCRAVMHYPNDRLFWLEGYPGDYFGILLVFDPLPLHVETLTYIEPEGEPFCVWGANWSGEVISNLSVQQLQRNQPLFAYHPRTVVRQPTNFVYSTDKYYTLKNKSTGARLGVSFDYNNHASAYRETAPQGRGPNGIKITEQKTFRFKFVPTAVTDTCSTDAVCADCFIVTEDLFALEDGSETAEGQWLIFRYLDKSNPCQQWTLAEKDGALTIINKATGRCVDLAGGETKEGAAVFSYTINGDDKTNANQKWVAEEARSLVTR